MRGETQVGGAEGGREVGAGLWWGASRAGCPKSLAAQRACTCRRVPARAGAAAAGAGAGASQARARWAKGSPHQPHESPAAGCRASAVVHASCGLVQDVCCGGTYVVGRARHGRQRSRRAIRCKLAGADGSTDACAQAASSGQQHAGPPAAAVGATAGRLPSRMHRRAGGAGCSAQVAAAQSSRRGTYSDSRTRSSTTAARLLCGAGRNLAGSARRARAVRCGSLRAPPAVARQQLLSLFAGFARRPCSAVSRCCVAAAVSASLPRTLLAHLATAHYCARAGRHDCSCVAAQYAALPGQPRARCTVRARSAAHASRRQQPRACELEGALRLHEQWAAAARVCWPAHPAPSSRERRSEGMSAHAR